MTSAPRAGLWKIQVLAQVLLLEEASPQTSTEVPPNICSAQQALGRRETGREEYKVPEILYERVTPY